MKWLLYLSRWQRWKRLWIEGNIVQLVVPPVVLPPESPSMLRKPHPDRMRCRLTQHTWASPLMALVSSWVTLKPLPPLTFTSKQVEELITQKLKEQKGEVMPILHDRVSRPFTPKMMLHPFSPKMMSIIIPRDVMTQTISDYKGEGDAIQHIQNYKSSLMGKTNDDNHFVFLFPTTLTSNTSYWFFGLPNASFSSWLNLKDKFIQYYMGERLLLKNVGSLDDI